MNDTSKMFAIAGLVIASGSTLTDDASAHISNAFNEISDILATDRKTAITTEYTRNYNSDCFIINSVGSSTMSISVPCNN